ncbi:sensor histidine kinase [Trichloromonas sp.]|uniref:sensor histidine kinase n=1 Tax=Trichloromonas sp. TaxID=3069249 RepID=UPI003D81428D
MGRTNSATVMLVDDDPLVRDSAARLLTEDGFTVFPCGDGQEALERLRDVSVDVVLSDIKMPGFSGIELLAKIRVSDPELPVLLMTGYADLGMAVASIQQGVFDFILKPYNPLQLLHSLAKAVEFKRLRQLEKNYQVELERRIMEVTRDLQGTHEKMLQGEKMATIGQLTAGVAHEINNPLGFIASNLGTLDKYAQRLLGFIGSLEKEIGSSCSAEVLEVLGRERRTIKLDLIREDIGPLIHESLEGADRLKKLIQSMKTFSRVDDSEFKPADINAGIETTIHICWNELKYVATLKKEYGELPLAKVYPQQLNQVFMNLLVNAAHAMDKPGEITIRTWYEEGFIFVSIADTGCGIPQETLGRIFEPFFTTKVSGKGTGLGLSIVKDILLKHNGEISVETVPGEGTIFTIKLPVV